MSGLTLADRLPPVPIVTNNCAMMPPMLLRPLPGGDRDKDIEILSLRHQLAVLQRQLDGRRVRFDPVDRAWLAALLHPLPRPTLRGLRLLARPATPFPNGTAT
jgi:hypothetical protein